MIRTLREKRRLENQLYDTEVESMRHSEAWKAMLYARKRMAVIQAISGEELSKKWDEFIDSLEKGTHRLGTLDSIDEKKFFVENGVHYLLVDYKQYDLKDKYTLNDYTGTIERFELCQSKIKETRAQLREIHQLLFNSLAFRILVFIFGKPTDTAYLRDEEGCSAIIRGV